MHKRSLSAALMAKVSDLQKMTEFQGSCNFYKSIRLPHTFQFLVFWNCICKKQFHSATLRLFSLSSLHTFVKYYKEFFEVYSNLGADRHPLLPFFKIKYSRSTNNNWYKYIEAIYIFDVQVYFILASFFFR